MTAAYSGRPAAYTGRPAYAGRPSADTTNRARVSVLDRMVWLANREADRIATWQGTDRDGHAVPKESWDRRQLAEHKLFHDLAQLANLVRLVEPEFRELLRSRLGSRKPPEATTRDGDPPSED